MSTFPNPLTGWGGQTDPNQFGSIPSPSPVPTVNTGASGNPGNLPNPTSNIKDSWRNQAFLNTLMQQFKLGLGGNWAQLMQGYAAPGASFFKTLMDLGSPFYQQKQRASAEQTEKSFGDEAGKARQQVQAMGAGYTPSGVGAATAGGMGVAEAQAQAENFLNNLFQNEQLQVAGAQGLESTASMFNPSSLLNFSSPQTTQGQTPGDTMSGVGSLFSSLFPTGVKK